MATKKKNTPVAPTKVLRVNKSAGTPALPPTGTEECPNCLLIGGYCGSNCGGARWFGK